MVFLLHASSQSAWFTWRARGSTTAPTARSQRRPAPLMRRQQRQGQRDYGVGVTIARGLARPPAQACGGMREE